MTAQRPEISESDVDGTASNVRSVPPAGAQAELEPVYSDHPAALADAGASNAGVMQMSSYASEHPAAAPSTPPAAASAPPPAPASVPPSAPPPAGSAADRPPSTPPEQKVVSAAGIAELREQLAKQESQNRVHELVKTLVALGDAVPDVDERVQLYARAADLYANKFMNQAEAVKANEKIFALQPSNASA